MPLIQKALPEARFIHVIRDGRDVALSVLDRTVRDDVDAAEVARRWRRKIERAHEDRPKLDHYLEVRYEDLVADPRPALERICEFIELPFDEAMLDYHERSGERLEEMKRELPEGDGLGPAQRRAPDGDPPPHHRAARQHPGQPLAHRHVRRRPRGLRGGRRLDPRPSSGYPLAEAPSVAFLICVEAGQLEQQGILFARSLRQFGGRFAACADPRLRAARGPRPRRRDPRRAGDARGDASTPRSINSEHAYYPFANKIYATAARRAGRSTRT